MWNSKFDPIERPYTAPEFPQGWGDADVLRLTNPDVDIADNINFAGQSVDAHGRIVGEKGYGKVEGGKVLIGAGEVALVKLQT
ncbi:uncharacterized protein TRUGW13939_07134 [Talaromyces rugulosus]|uniref:Uncharacterized protein n=1 Tax=Talaromyces rugulosus TaxID=121627 RepID=A0A7H8R0U2_TALRU|nr:uncharacterized protein TRUGW13939_07134 [Talaromyces rugulosus]QKX59992.1 hypothetical protein TRUGW13939_07134 [Talaromyces rugulosus]